MSLCFLKLSKASVATFKVKIRRNTKPNKFSLLPSPKGEGQDEGIHITTYWDWYNPIMPHFMAGR
jgi:hypothetical protein